MDRQGRDAIGRGAEQCTRQTVADSGQAQLNNFLLKLKPVTSITRCRTQCVKDEMKEKGEEDEEDDEEKKEKKLHTTPNSSAVRRGCNRWRADRQQQTPATLAIIYMLYYTEIHL